MHAFDRQTDRQTDGQTDGQTDRNLIVKTALHSMQRGKNPYSRNAKLRSAVTPVLLGEGAIKCRSMMPACSAGFSPSLSRDRK